MTHNFLKTKHQEILQNEEGGRQKHLMLLKITGVKIRDYRYAKKFLLTKFGKTWHERIDLYLKPRIINLSKFATLKHCLNFFRVAANLVKLGDLKRGDIRNIFFHHPSPPPQTEKNTP